MLIVSRGLKQMEEMVRTFGIYTARLKHFSCQILAQLKQLGTVQDLRVGALAEAVFSLSLFHIICALIIYIYNYAMSVLDLLVFSRYILLFLFYF